MHFTIFIDYVNIAKGSNLQTIDDIVTSVNELTNILSTQNSKGSYFVCVKCGLDDETPRPPLDVVKVKAFK